MLLGIWIARYWPVSDLRFVLKPSASILVEFGSVLYVDHVRFDPRHPLYSLVTRPHPQEGERVWYITSEFLVVLSQHVRKTGNPIRLLDLLKSCDMKEN